MIVSCQKDEDIKGITTADQTPGPDSTAGNYLATGGIIKITIQDSTYSFDAANDSIAFVNVHTDNGQYYGITAINKAHTMSFGISSAGYPLDNSTGKLAGSQFLFKNDKKTGGEYSLTQYANPQDTGKISLVTYKRDSILAQGSFYTYLAKAPGATPAFYKVKGTFSLRLK